jgi:hypothetical protein
MHGRQAGQQSSGDFEYALGINLSFQGRSQQVNELSLAEARFVENLGDDRCLLTRLQEKFGPRQYCPGLTLTPPKKAYRGKDGSVLLAFSCPPPAVPYGEFRQPPCRRTGKTRFNEQRLIAKGGSSAQSWNNTLRIAMKNNRFARDGVRSLMTAGSETNLSKRSHSESSRSLTGAVIQAFHPVVTR